MRRIHVVPSIIGILIGGVLATPVIVANHDATDYKRQLDAAVKVADQQHQADLARITALEGELAQARRHADAVDAQLAAAAERSRAEKVRASRSRRVVVHTVDSACGSSWRDSLGADERWIYERESGLNPNSRNASGAYGLGQLMPGTYRDLGIAPDSNPCHQIAAARRYMHNRYHSWSNARAFWESHSWW